MIKQFIYKYLWWTYRPIKSWYIEYRTKQYRIKETAKLDTLVANSDKERIFYLGITEHANLGDMAQHFCILKWINENYPCYELHKFESSVVTDERFNFIERFKKVYRSCDIIVFQSGYCTQDLGGTHELMHRLICDAIPDARILMMPQTIYFQKEENKQRTSKSYNQAHNMLFLARDFISYDMAKEMFPDIKVAAYPDIVTTLIGTIEFNNKRDGVCVCTRNDGEKYYSDSEISKMVTELQKTAKVVQKDTQAKVHYKEIRKNLKEHIYREIESYSHYNVTITDRYHGTIFSLAAGTPVIIIKTTDHKVTTGADWFKGIYDDYVYVAKDLDDALNLYKKVMNLNLPNKLAPHMKENYYDKLKVYFESKK